MRRVRAAGLAVLLGVGACTSSGSPPGQTPVTVRLLAFNDFHGQLRPPAAGVTVGSAAGPVRLSAGGAAHLGGLIGRLRQESPGSIVVAAGDLIGASPLDSAMFHDEPSIEVLSGMGLAVTAVGNHELDHGIAELHRMQDGGCLAGAAGTSCVRGPFKGAAFRYLAANIIDRRTGRPVFSPTLIREVAVGGGRRVRIGFIGAVTRTAAHLVIPEGIKGVELTDEADAVNAQVPALQAAGVDAIVLLIHEGGVTAQQQFDDTSCEDFKGAIIPILERLDPAVRLVVSGHTHQVYICSREGRLITSAGSQGQYLTVIDLTLDPAHHRQPTATARQLAVVNDQAPDPLPEQYPPVPASAAARAVVDYYTAAARSAADRRITRIDAPITRAASPAGESALGDLVADAQLAGTAAPAAGGAQLAMINATGLRVDLHGEGGWVTYGELFAVQPFGNRLITLTLTGEQLHAVLEHQWEPGGPARLLQVSHGFSYQWDPQAPVGARVDVHTMRLNGMPIDPSARYRVTVNDFLAGGGDGFTGLTQGTERIYGARDVDMLERYLATHTPPPFSESRILRREAAHSSAQ